MSPAKNRHGGLTSHRRGDCQTLSGKEARAEPGHRKELHGQCVPGRTRWRLAVGPRGARHAAGKMVEHLANTEINSQRIAAVESCFGASGQPLALPGRVLLGEGVLTKECRKKAKPRIFFLFNDILVYGSIVLSKRKYHSQHIIPLEEVTLEPLPETLQAKNRWMIRTAKKSFAVSAASATERQEWISHIEECVRRQLRATGRPPSTEHAAPWIPDKATDICMRCTQTRFSALTRRHHCRKCGFVVCADCSRARFLLPRLAPKPLRVCSLCYRELAAQERAGAGAGPPAGAGSGASSGEDEDDSEEDKEGSGDGDWPSRVKFYGEGVSWSSFHS
ncbi:pleckstrin homology domain-containing family F member 1 isoform X6 [Pteropus medius]|uniref:pleckstrin homology domain-containing family F member 1 isoform X6 n=1 Tax=Pteropus vampyrus TaxID=132908 RepID=UPI00196A80BF|nr:pleckstrin homology domain-containing family F member 1 isoform X6 [Pteropus giganteus]